MENQSLNKNGKEKLDRFVEKMEVLIRQLHENNSSRNYQKDYTNQFYYMTKREELYALYERVQEAEKDLTFYKKMFNNEYKEVFLRWQRDARAMERNKEADSTGEVSVENVIKQTGK